VLLHELNHFLQSDDRCRAIDFPPGLGDVIQYAMNVQRGGYGRHEQGQETQDQELVRKVKALYV
jgi:hypothetical protein